jgi:hypothetical protein
MFDLLQEKISILPYYFLSRWNLCRKEGILNEKLFRSFDVLEEVINFAAFYKPSSCFKVFKKENFS